jgi:hypothetical protein
MLIAGFRGVSLRLTGKRTLWLVVFERLRSHMAVEVQGGAEANSAPLMNEPNKNRNLVRFS